MDYSVNREKLDQAVACLKKEGIDLWLIVTSEGSDPCLPLVTGVHTVGPGAFAISADGEKTALCSSIDAQDIEESGLFTRVVKYTEGLGPALAALVKSKAPARIALNYSQQDHLCDGLTLGRFRWLKAALAGSFAGEYLSSESFLGELRSIKSPEELRRIKKAIELTLEIYAAVFARLETGLTERKVGMMFREELERRGLESGTTAMPIVLKGNIAHRLPSDAEILPGDMLIMDFSVAYMGYVSDIARTAYFLKAGEEAAPEAYNRTFRAAYGAISAAKAALKPGALGFEVDMAAREYLLRQGMPEISHATGHQIGRECHDGGTLLGPCWPRYGQAPYGKVEAGMLFTLEPTILPDKPPFILTEENLLVTETGSEFLSVRQESLVLVPAGKRTARAS
jgi:Xaa-Pro aminopeptidase